MAPLIPTNNTQRAKPCIICWEKRSAMIFLRNTPTIAPTAMATPFIKIITEKLLHSNLFREGIFLLNAIPQKDFVDLQTETLSPRFRAFFLKNKLVQ